MVKDEQAFEELPEPGLIFEQYGADALRLYF